MIRSLLILTVILCGNVAYAKASKTYDFGNTDDYLAPASAMSDWQEILQRHSSQREDLRKCVSPKGCKGRLRSYQLVMERAGSLSEDEQLHLVNYYINRNDYDHDKVRRIYDDNGKKVSVRRTEWITLYDFLLREGDCEDYATSKYFMLRELGYPPDQLRIVVTYVRQLHGYHAVLAVRRSDGSVWLLDSDNRIRKRSHGEYRYVYAVNEQSIWDHRKDYPGSAKMYPMGLKKGLKEE